MAYSLSDLLSYCLQVGAAELVIAENNVPSLRMLGRMLPIPGAAVVPAGFVARHLDTVLPMHVATQWGELGHAQFRGGPWLERLWRITLARQAFGAVAYFKPIPKDPADLSSLGTPEAMRPLLVPSPGLVLFSGPACSGKTSTATALTSTLCARGSLRVRSLQRVAECPLDAGASLLHEREGDLDLEREIYLGLKSGTDVFFLGDLPLEQMGMALAAAESGAMVVATLRAGNMVGVFDRIMDSGSSLERDQIRSMLALHLRTVVVQYLVPDIENRTGVPAWEVLHHCPALVTAVRSSEHFRFPQILRTSAAEGMLSLDESLALLVHNGRVDKKEAARIAFEPGRFH